MKKIYSFVLMAVALLIGTNASAGNFPGNSAAELQDAIYAIMSGQTSDNVITLTQPVELNRTVWVGTVSESDPFKSITIDLNGHDITMVGTLKDGTKADRNSNRPLLVMFTITHGELKVINSSATQAEVKFTGVTANNSRIFEVMGTYRSSRWNEDGNALVGDGINTREQGWFTHLEIGPNVMLHAAEHCRAEGIAISVTGINGNKYFKDASNLVTVPDGHIFSSSYGYANGVRVDFKGKMNIEGDGLTTAEQNDNVGKAEKDKTVAKVYGFSVKGNVRAATTQTGGVVLTNNYATNYFSNNDPAYNNEGQLIKEATHKLDTVDAPFLWIAPDAEIVVRNDGDKVGAIYAGGYAKWLIQGHVAGKTGLYASSGVMDLNDAFVESTANTWENTSNIGSANGGGSGVVLNSRDAYAGGIEFVVSGDTKIKSLEGYAIEEAVNTTTVIPNPAHETDPTAPEFIPEPKASNIVIESGTIEGGDKGAIIISAPTVAASSSTEEDAPTVVVYGGNVTGETYAGSIDGGDLDELMPKTGDYYQTEITVGGKTVIVINQGDANDIHESASIYEATNDSIKWTGPNETLAGNKTLDYLEIKADGAQVLRIPDQVTLTAGRVIMDTDAKIIVEPGGKFIVTGEDGIVAPVVDNILVEASETKQGMFFFNPAVKSNRHPYATVQLYTNCYQKADAYVYQRLTIPVKDGMKPDNNFSGTTYTGSPFTSYAWYWNGNIWASIAKWADLKPFVGYEFTNNSAAPGVTYTFKGQLVGNNDATYNFPTGGFDYFGCSHLAPIYVDSLLMPYENTDVEATAWVYDFANTNWVAINHEQIAEGFAPEEIQPMSAFVLRIHNVATGTAGMSYASAVWGNPNMDALLGRPSQKNPAPARNRANTTNRAMISVVAENGYGDNVKLIEKDNFTAEFENGADASKFMWEEGINLYASTEAGDLACVATDDLKGTLLSFRSGISTQYTISMSNVLGEDYALRDNVTGQVITLAEGATYTFMQEANTTVPARFEVIGVAEVPTAIDNVEETAKVNGIYTMTGQYVGRDFTQLPAGVYVVNGVKIVK